jgi:membrane-associated phospholipid phosphatase
VNPFDYSILAYLSGIGHRSPLLARAIIVIFGSDLKTAFIAALLWWAWFDTTGNPERQQENRVRIAACLCGCLVAILLVRVMALLLPFRLRPLNNPALGLEFPISAGSWGEWSAFPSDNALLFFFISACLFSISRPIGLLALLDTAFLICLPRLFVGVHHPTDILGGAAMGTAGAYVVEREWLRNRLSAPILYWARSHTGSFYAAGFLFSYLIATVFWPALNLAIQIATFFSSSS